MTLSRDCAWDLDGFLGRQDGLLVYDIRKGCGTGYSQNGYANKGL